MSEFRLEVVASPDDVDELGHVSNLVYLRWVLDAARAHSRAVGWDFDAYRRLGAVWVVRHHEIDYLQPAFGGDRLQIVTWVESWAAASSVRRTRIERDGRELAHAATQWVFVALDGGRPRRIPAEMRNAF